MWNASAASGVSVATLCAPFDTVSVCFSKGLGAPVGSALCGTRDLVLAARRFRKMWGGGMRQVGLLAAAARYALAHHRVRIAEDHSNAQRLAELLTTPAHASFRVDVPSVETNIVNIDVVRPPGQSAGQGYAEQIAARAREARLLINAAGPLRLRAVTHLDVSRADIERAARILRDAV